MYTLKGHLEDLSKNKIAFLYPVKSAAMYMKQNMGNKNLFDAADYVGFLCRHFLWWNIQVIAVWAAKEANNIAKKFQCLLSLKLSGK